MLLVLQFIIYILFEKVILLWKYSFYLITAKPWEKHPSSPWLFWMFTSHDGYIIVVEKSMSWNVITQKISISKNCITRNRYNLVIIYIYSTSPLRQFGLTILMSVYRSSSFSHVLLYLFISTYWTSPVRPVFLSVLFNLFRFVHYNSSENHNNRQ